MFLPISPEKGGRAGLRNVSLRSELRRWIKSRRRRRRRRRMRIRIRILFYSARSLYLAGIQTTNHLAHILATVPTY
jgi:hypothetical protein